LARLLLSPSLVNVMLFDPLGADPGMMFVAHLAADSVITGDLVVPQSPAPMHGAVVLTEYGQGGKRNAEQRQVGDPS
jgi:hypothetical protein